MAALCSCQIKYLPGNSGRFFISVSLLFLSLMVLSYDHMFFRLIQRVHLPRLAAFLSLVAVLFSCRGLPSLAHAGHFVVDNDASCCDDSAACTPCLGQLVVARVLTNGNAFFDTLFILFFGALSVWLVGKPNFEQFSFDSKHYEFWPNFIDFFTRLFMKGIMNPKVF